MPYDKKLLEIWKDLLETKIHRDLFSVLYDYLYGFNEEDTTADVDRFAGLHSWYKHLPKPPKFVSFYCFPAIGEQARYDFDHRIDDPIGMHWHFHRDIDQIKLTVPRVITVAKKYPIELDCEFGYGDDKAIKACVEAARSVFKELTVLGIDVETITYV